MKHYLVLGNPIEHSLSPDIQRIFAEQTGVLMTYKKMLVKDDGFSQCIAQLQKKKIGGANVTAPFKQQAYQLMTKCTVRATLAKAVNTIKFMPDGTMLGDNTDGIGLVTDLQKNKGFKLNEAKILIIGAGGATRGILHSLLETEPSQVVVANRTKEKAISIRDTFEQYGDIHACGIDELEKFEKPQFDLVINATSASLSGNDLKLPHAIICHKTICYDLNYSDGATSFLGWCAQQNATALHHGFGMLVEQAAESFYLWHNEKPDTKTAMKQLAIDNVSRPFTI